jgi:hypothetical protein
MGLGQSHDGPRYAAVRSERAALFPRESELWPDLLKEGFNCPDQGPNGVRPVFIRGERMENIAL